MPPAEKPLVYLILGASGSGRREVLADLIADGLDEGDRAAVMLAQDEESDAFDAKLPAVTRWTWDGTAIDAVLPREATHVFFVTHGRRSPVDQVEAFKGWLEMQSGELARVLCVVNCQLAEKKPPMLAWYEACVHFADVVLLNRRDGVDNKWLSAFHAHFKKLFYPCLFETVKAGRVKNPALVLVPEARRMTHIFDADQDWIFTDASGEEIDEQDETDDEDGVEVKPEEDPYLARHSSGIRVKIVPDLAKFL